MVGYRKLKRAWEAEFIIPNIPWAYQSWRATILDQLYRVSRYGLVVVVAMYAFKTIDRNRVWHSRESLFE